MACLNLVYIFRLRVELIIVMNILSLLAVGVIGGIATGSNPDHAGRMADKRQEYLAGIKGRVNLMAGALIDLKVAHSEIARKIGAKVNVETITERLKGDDPLQRLPFDVSALEAAKSFALGEELPANTPLEIKTYILVKTGYLEAYSEQMV